MLLCCVSHYRRRVIKHYSMLGKVFYQDVHEMYRMYIPVVRVPFLCRYVASYLIHTTKQGSTVYIISLYVCWRTSVGKRYTCYARDLADIYCKLCCYNRDTFSRNAGNSIIHTMQNGWRPHSVIHHTLLKYVTTYVLHKYLSCVILVSSYNKPLIRK